MKLTTSSNGLVFVVLLTSLGVYGQDGNQEDESADVEKRVAQLFASVQASIRKSDYKSADKQLSKVIELAPKLSSAFYNRGRVRFQAGDIKGSISDFDQHIQLSPQMKSRQWERGIALYYARKFEDGAKQFEIYQTYHDNDVENSAWRFLCVARSKGVEAARKNLLPIRNDRRIPMMQIYEMYQGKKSPQEVLEAAEKFAKTESQKNSARFYANLYVGLLYEVEGKPKLAKKHIQESRKHRINHYMWNVADVHLDLLSRQESTKSAEPKK